MAATKRTTSESPERRQHRPPNVRIIQNFHLVWLGESNDEENNEVRRNSITKLRQIVNTVNIFVDVDECVDFINSNKEERIFMIFSGFLSQKIVPVVHDKPQVDTMYIFCDNKVQDEKWEKEWPKIKGVFTDITSLCEALRFVVQACDHNSVSISFVKSTEGTPFQSLDTLDQSFMYTQILKEILLTIDFEQSHFNEFLTYCRDQFVSNDAQLENVEKLAKEYRCHEPIWWYTNEYFLYFMLNKALRTMEVDLIIKMGFFLRDLHNHIVELQVQQYGQDNFSSSFTVYRGQGLSQIDFEKLKKTQGGLISFNNFLSTSLDQGTSLAFAESNQYNSDMVGVLFVIIINPSISSSPFADVRDVSCFAGEEEILFSMHSVFRIGQMKQTDGNPRLWRVDLTLTSDNDSQLRDLTQRIREETYPHLKGWYRLGSLLVKMGQFGKAQTVFDTMIDRTTEEGEKGDVYYQLGLVKVSQGEYKEAIIFYEKSLKIREKIYTSQHYDVAECYNDIGNVYSNMGEYSKALSYYEKAHEIKQNTLPVNHPHLSISYNNIGNVYRNMGEYSKALSLHEKGLEIQQKTLPANHPHLAISYNNIGAVYDKIKEYSKALLYYEKALQIYEKILPANHPDLAISFNNIGAIFDNIADFLKALLYYEKALEIKQKTLPATHPDLAITYNNIGAVHNNLGEYSKALSSHKQARKIKQTSLPANHPSLAITYSNIGFVYYNMREYSKAYSYYERALVILQCSLPPNHPSIESVKNSIDLVKKNL